MATYGAKHLQWAPFKETGADDNPKAFPLYGTPVNLGPLVAVTDNITSAEAKNYGDNGLEDYANEFQEVGVDIEVTELPIDAAVPLFGASLDETSKDLEYGAEDAAPYGGLAFYVNKMIKGKKGYQGIYYPKLKASRQGATYNTKAQSITFANSKLKMTGSASAKGKYQVMSPILATEAEAEAWVDTKIKASV